jgi:hypothetical protein
VLCPCVCSILIPLVQYTGVKEKVETSFFFVRSTQVFCVILLGIYLHYNKFVVMLGLENSDGHRIWICAVRNHKTFFAGSFYKQ